MGLIEQSTGRTTNGLIIISVLLSVAALASTRMRQGQERT
jgi:hypothetical protein